MKNIILFLLAIAFFACEKEEAFELTEGIESKEEGLLKRGFGTSPPTGCPEGDLNSLFRLSPYVVPTALCYSLYHSGYEYETLVYVQNKKPYTRRVTVFGWRNGNRSSIPNTYTITIPANSYSSNQVNTFPSAHMAYSSILVEVSSVLKQTPLGWVPETDYKATCAEIEVENCYLEQLDCHLTNSCDEDDDGDGVNNSSDLCPDTPSGHAVDANGCSGNEPPVIH